MCASVEPHDCRTRSCSLGFKATSDSHHNVQQQVQGHFIPSGTRPARENPDTFFVHASNSPNREWAEAHALGNWTSFMSREPTGRVITVIVHVGVEATLCKFGLGIENVYACFFCFICTVGRLPKERDPITHPNRILYSDSKDTRTNVVSCHVL